MLLEKFSEIIDRSGIGAAISDRQRMIEQTNPNRIYVENVRSFFHIPSSVAKGLLDLAVRSGELEKRVGVLCPNCERMIADAESGYEPDQVSCNICEVNGEEHSCFPLDACQKIEFYRVRKKA